MKKLLFIFVVFSTLFIACDEDNDELTYEEQLAKDIEKIQDYLNENGLSANAGEDGLYYIIEEEGIGSVPTVDSTVKVKYTGKYLDDEVFGSGTIEAELNKFILGWQLGIPYFKEGGNGTLYIPSGLGYGIHGYGTIPKNEVLIFDIELIDVSD
ncbi:MAG: peptidylprolyl isomerase [Marinilabiliales bacterium]|nr:MAG: peptidylprolyl isomerase [Marinilabiliales bacterium]